MACEAVTNSIRHSNSGRPRGNGGPGTVTLTVLDTGEATRVEVLDAGSPDNVPRMADDDPDSSSGRGLRMLDALSAGRWGSYAHAGGRTVWFDVALGPTTGAPDPRRT